MKVMKRILAALLCIVMCISMAGCGGQDKSWCVKDGDEQIPVGIYRYYLFLAFDEAAALVSDKEEVLKATIEGTPAEDWIRNRALDYVRCYLWINDKNEELGFELTEEEIASAKNNTAYLEQNTNATFEDLGISTSSFTKAYGEYNIKFKKIFDYYYGEGGEKAIGKEELRELYCADKCVYEYIFANITETDATGKTTTMTADEIAEVKETLELYRKQVEMGACDMKAAASALGIALGIGGEPPYAAGVTNFMYENFTAEFVTNLKEMDNFEARVIESGDQLMLLYKHDINTAFEKTYEIPQDRLDLMLELKADEFTDWVLEQARAAKADIKVNEAAIKEFKLSRIVTDDIKMGLYDAEADE